MPHRPSSTRAATTVLATVLALAGIGLLAALWRKQHAPRRESQRTRRVRGCDDLAAAAAPVESAAVECASDVQTASDGAGHVNHRRYEITLPNTSLSCETLLGMMQQNFAELSPTALAEFEKTQGSAWQMRVGDEYTITMLGPWNGAVRVSACDATSFTLVTLEGHPEAGHITFSVHDDDLTPGALRVRIESWARSRDAVVDVAYATLGIGKQVQTEVWVTFLQRVSALAGVSDAPEVHITTEQLAEAAPTPGADV